MELPVNCAKAMNMLAKTKAQLLDVKMSNKLIPSQLHLRIRSVSIQ